MVFLAVICSDSKVEAAAFNFVKDVISTSAPAADANYTIEFKTATQIPASGKIIITFQSGTFTIPSALGISDIDFLIDGSQRTLSSSPGSGAGSAFGVSVVSGTSGSVTFSLNDTDAITAASAIVIKIGSNATFGALGAQRIKNPATAGSYGINIRTKSAGDNLIDSADTMIAIISPVNTTAKRVIAPPPPPPPPPPSPPPSPASLGVGGGGVIYIPPSISIVFSGRAYPGSAVTLLKDAQIAASTVAGSDANFQITLSGLSGGNYIFSIYGEDKNGVRSSLFTFSLTITVGVTINVSGLFIAPTISVDKSEVKKGDVIAIFGQSVPRGNITIMVSSSQDFFAKTVADKDGIYLYNLNTASIEYGDHSVKSKAVFDGLVSGFSNTVGFKVGTRNVLAPKIVKRVLKGDINGDGRVNLIDFSIAAYWYKRALTPAFKTIEAKRLNGDGKVNLVDFSIMAYYWTG